LLLLLLLLLLLDACELNSKFFPSHQSIVARSFPRRCSLCREDDELSPSQRRCRLTWPEAKYE
jgi:hypothetical protein